MSGPVDLCEQRVELRGDLLGDPRPVPPPPLQPPLRRRGRTKRRAGLLQRRTAGERLRESHFFTQPTPPNRDILEEDKRTFF